jgi:hypothetical protein
MKKKATFLSAQGGRHWVCSSLVLQRRLTILNKRMVRWFVGATLGLATVIPPVPLTAAAAPGGSQRLTSRDTLPQGLSATDWSSIREQMQVKRHAALLVEGGHQARNPGQQWQTRFDGRGFTTRPDAGGWEWGLELQRPILPGVYSSTFAGHLPDPSSLILLSL